MPKLKPTIVIDTREQNPFKFERLPTCVSTLNTGDYSVAGLEEYIAVERKSLSDLLGCVGQQRDRFKRELKRLCGYPYRLLVIEATAEEISAGKWRSALHPNHVVGALSSWCGKYGLMVWPGGTRKDCTAYVERFLFNSCRTIVEMYSAAADFLELDDGDDERDATD